jgi:hypothetical protein
MLYMVTFTINIPQMLAYIYTIHGSYGYQLIISYVATAIYRSLFARMLQPGHIKSAK